MGNSSVRLPKLMLLAVGIACALCACAKDPAASAERTGNQNARSVEVMHWLTSKPDAAALAVIKNGLIARGGTWLDSPMPGDGATGRAAAINRIVGGQPPDVFQFSIGAELSELVSQHLVEPVPLDATAAGAGLPRIILEAASVGGRQIAIPMDIRGENWLFYNVSVLREANVAVPRTWAEVLAAAEKLKAAGKIPIALGGQSWQERLLFNDILLGVGGRDFYRRVYQQFDRSAFESPTLRNVLQIFAALRPFVDAGSPGRRWGQTAQLMIRGDAAFQFIGDWVKSEIAAAGLRPGVEIGCVLAPATEDAYVMMVDAFVFARTSRPNARAGQALFAQVVNDPTVQTQLSRSIGGIPARNDVESDGFDPCSVHAMRILRDPAAQLMDPGLSLPGGLSGAIDDVISKFWNNPRLSALEGSVLLRDAVFSYR